MSDIKEFNSDLSENENQDLKFKKFRKYSRRKILLITVLVLFTVTFIAGLGFAKNFRDSRHMDGDPMGFLMGRIVKDLNLTEQQKTDVNKIKDEIKAKMDENRQKRKSDASEFEQMFRSDTFDKQKAMDLSQKHETEREEMRQFMIDEMARFHSILTPDQRNKAMDKMKEMREKHEKNKGDWHKPDKQ